MVEVIEPIKREWLKELRKAKKMTVREIAEHFGVSFQHYSDIENGRRNPSFELSLKIADFFKVEVNLLFSERTKFRRTFQDIKREFEKSLERAEMEND